MMDELKDNDLSLDHATHQATSVKLWFVSRIRHPVKGNPGGARIRDAASCVAVVIEVYIPV